MPLTARDRKCAAEGLERLATRNWVDSVEIQRELQVMLMLNYKGEIQALDYLGDMTDWLDEHLSIL